MKPVMYVANVAEKGFEMCIRDSAYGLMATTWFHVQRNDRDLVDWIIRSSGMLFRNPDAAVPPRPASAAPPEGHGWTAP